MKYVYYCNNQSIQYNGLAFVVEMHTSSRKLIQAIRMFLQYKEHAEKIYSNLKFPSCWILHMTIQVVDFVNDNIL